MLTIKRHGGWKSASVAEKYVEDSVYQKRKIENMITTEIQAARNTKTSSFTQKGKFTYKTPKICKSIPQPPIHQSILCDYDSLTAEIPVGSINNEENSNETEGIEMISSQRSYSEYISEEYEYEKEVKVEVSEVKNCSSDTDSKKKCFIFKNCSNFTLQFK